MSEPPATEAPMAPATAPATAVHGDPPARGRADWQIALVPWIVARVVVVAALAVARRAFSELGSGARPAALGQGLFAYDAAFYREIAEAGYHRAGGGLRFFPLVSLLARGLGRPFGDHVDVALIVIVNACAFGFLVVLAKLTRLETGDERVVHATVWLGAIAPPAVALVLGYSEAAFLLLAVGVFWCLRTQHPAAAVPLGILAGLARPLGVLLAVPAFVELVRTWRVTSVPRRAWGVAATVAPAVGTAIYLAWVGAVYGDPLLPARIQQASNLRGRSTDPVSALVEATADGFRGQPTAALHVVVALGCVGLLWIAARRLPVSYAAFAGVSVLVALSAENLSSFERYGFSAFPLLIAAGLLLRAPFTARIVVAASTVGLFVLSVSVFLGRYVP